MDTMWFVVLAVVMADPNAGDSHRTGDLMLADIVAASVTEDLCRDGAARLAGWLEQTGSGRVKVAADCVELPSSVAEYLGFTQIGWRYAE